MTGPSDMDLLNELAPPPQMVIIPKSAVDWVALLQDIVSEKFGHTDVLHVALDTVETWLRMDATVGFPQ